LFLANKQLLHISKLVKSHMSASALYFFPSLQKNSNCTCVQLVTNKCTQQNTTTIHGQYQLLHVSAPECQNM